MPLDAEVTDRLQPRRSCDGLLYAPLAHPMTWESSVRYRFEFGGDRNALGRFVRAVLVDETSQELHLDVPPARTGWAMILDYGMKPGCLDLERETILRYHRDSGPQEFEIEGLTIRRRLYLFSDASGPISPDPFIRDVFNPAIHNWTVSHAGS